MIEYKLPYADQEARRLILDYYPYYSTKILAIILGMPIGSIYKEAYRLGLNKTPEVLKELLKEQNKLLTEKGKAYRFQKGQTPANKGKKTPAKVYEKIRPTMFKPGNKPHNSLKVGAEIITRDGYIKVKMAEPNQWKHKHRMVWERAHGAIPKGYNVQFRDGNRNNLSLSNLFIISRSEQMSLNSIIRYPKEVRKAIHSLSKLNKTISSHETD